MRIDFTPDPALFPFESRWFEGSAGRIHYVDEGTGPTLLLCHGNPTWSFLYRDIILALCDRFRCVAADYLGFGLSDRPESGYEYTIEEHVRTFGELVDHLDLDDFVLVAQDWGGPIGTGVAVERADRVRGVCLGNTWFWPSPPSLRTFSRVMGSRPMQHQILERNFFVRRLIPLGTGRKLSAAELRHYEAVQPSPAARRGVARMPKEIRAATLLLERLGREVPDRLGAKPALFVWGMKDFAFRPNLGLPRMVKTFPDHEVVELATAKHYIQEDAPAEIAAAIDRRFGAATT